MSQMNLGSKAFIANTDLEAFRRVKLTTGTGNKVDYANAGEACIGMTAAKALKDDFVTVDLKYTGQTFKAVALDAIVAGGNFYGAIDGKVSSVVNGAIMGKVLEASSSDLEVIEILFV